MAGQSTGTQCIFPFTFDGVIHKACTRHGIEDTEYEPWCSTKVDDVGDHISGNWGDCSQDCPFEVDCLTVAGPSTGTKCMFPFLQNGVIHNACTRHGIEDSEDDPWCRTNDGNWGDCGTDCPFEPGNITSLSCPIFIMAMFITFLIVFLGLKGNKNAFADFITFLYINRKLNSLIFLDNHSHQDLLIYLQFVNMDMFTSDSPIFLPNEYSAKIELRLDNNIVFYKSSINGSYSLIDRYTVNGGPEMVMEIGTWDKNGVTLTKKMNRWDRRTNLMGSKFVNTLYENEVGGAFFVYGKNGTIIGSRGHYQDQLFYILEGLNVTIETRSESEELEGAADCYDFILHKLTDICSGGYIDYPCDNCYQKHIITKRPAGRTLLAGVPQTNTLDPWAYVEVFGLTQWIILFFSITLISFMIPLYGVALGGTNHGFSTIESFANTSLFILQQGNHPRGRLKAQAIVSLTTSMLTLLFFIYYSNDITAKMTAGSPPHPVRTFQDVLHFGYKIILVGSIDLVLLRDAKNGSAKRTVYDAYFEEANKQIVQFEDAMFDGNLTLMNKIVLPTWYNFTAQNLDWAANQVIHDSKTLWYCQRDCATDKIEQGTVIDLRMDDTTYTYGGFMLRKDSEYLSLISHYVKKGFETGIYHRIHLTYSSRIPIKIGLTEPGALKIENVMGPFTVLGTFIIISVGIALIERMVKICTN